MKPLATIAAWHASAVANLRPTETQLKLVLSAGLVVAIAAAAAIWPTCDDAFSQLGWLIWPAMLLHQCEENVFTELVLRRRFAFLPWVRTVGYDITPGRAIALNVGIGWTLAIAAGLAGARYPLMPLFIIGVEGVNAFWHLSVTSLQQRWSPGTLSSLLVTIPLAFTLFHQSLEAGVVGPWECWGLLVAAAVSHHRFLGSLPRPEVHAG